jgi:hypothetical protein
MASFRALRGLAALSLCLLAGLARAQDYAPPEDDPPERAARLSYIQGDVSLQPAGEEEWTAAIVNRPLTTGDKLWTDQRARAEIDVGRAAVRLDSGTGFSFLNVDDDTIQMRITAGVVNVSVRDLAGNEHIEIDTPNLALSLLRPGNYRVEVTEDGDSSIVRVSEGLAEASDGSQSVIVHAQQVATFRGTEQLAAQFSVLGAPDDFDSWSLERERRDERAETSQTAQYVAPDVTGYEDLNDNGTWSSETEYGYVWTPTHVAVGWSPYQYGRWSWVGPWGWTWIDDAPWGYAPFHYGRWAHVRDRWCWVPGPRYTRAVYAPALVGWTGLHGGVAWFPLGPREVYVPAHRYSHRYVERVNLANTVIANRSHLSNVYGNQITTTPYRNRSVPGAMIAVARNTFTSAQRVNGHRIRIDDQEIARTPVSTMPPRIEPVRESRLGATEARRNVRVPPQTVASRQVVVRREPPPSSAHFARHVVQTEAGREQTAVASRPQVRRDQPVNRAPSAQLDAVRPAPQAVESRAPDAHRDPAAQNWREERTREALQRTDRPPADYRPRADDVPRQREYSQPEVRPSAERHPEIRQQVREHLERQLQTDQQQQALRQAEAQQRQQRDQQQQQQQQQYQQQYQQQQQHQQQQRDQPRDVQQQRPAGQPQRPEPTRPAESKPQPRQNDDNTKGDRQRGWNTDRR